MLLLISAIVMLLLISAIVMLLLISAIGHRNSTSPLSHRSLRSSPLLSRSIGNFTTNLNKLWCQEGSSISSFTLVLATATGLGLLEFTEVEAIPELLALAVLIQLVRKKIMFAEEKALVAFVERHLLQPTSLRCGAMGFKIALHFH